MTEPTGGWFRTPKTNKVFTFSNILTVTIYTAVVATAIVVVVCIIRDTNYHDNKTVAYPEIYGKKLLKIEETGTFSTTTTLHFEGGIRLIVSSRSPLIRTER